MQPKDAQDEHHDDDETHKVNDAVHGAVTSGEQSNLGLCAFELSRRKTRCSLACSKDGGEALRICEPAEFAEAADGRANSSGDRSLDER